MIETFNDFVSLIVLVIIIFGGIFTAIRINGMYKNNRDDDEYYQDLL